MKNRGRGKKSHQTTEFEIASCQLGLLFFVSHYVAGLFGDGCLSATVTGITMIAVLCFCYLQREKDRRTCSSIALALTQKGASCYKVSEVESSQGNYLRYITLLFVIS